MDRDAVLDEKTQTAMQDDLGTMARPLQGLLRHSSIKSTSWTEHGKSAAHLFFDIR